jgi:hypothetical protein
MAADQPFLVPVVIDDVPDSDPRVPDRFREVQWTKLPGGEAPPAFVALVAGLAVVAVSAFMLMHGKSGVSAHDFRRLAFSGTGR